MELRLKDEIDEFNKFINENMVRNRFAPILGHIMEHLLKFNISPEEFVIDEFCDTVTKETSRVTFSIKTDKLSIDGSISYDPFDKDSKEKNLMSYDISWGEENYVHLYTPIQVMNWLSFLFGCIKIPDNVDNGYNWIRKQENLIPLI